MTGEIVWDYLIVGAGSAGCVLAKFVVAGGRGLRSGENFYNFFPGATLASLRLHHDS